MNATIEKIIQKRNETNLYKEMYDYDFSYYAENENSDILKFLHLQILDEAIAKGFECIVKYVKM